MRLLLAEDEKSLSKALKTILEHHNYTVDAVYDGQEALDYLANGEYDGIILDIMMPKVDGFTVLKELRKYDHKTPVLVLTAKTQVEDRVKGLDLGADDYLGKPFSSSELLARVRAMLRRYEPQVDDILTFKDLTLNRLTYEISSSIGSRRLVGKEYQLLELLMLKNGQPISAEQFMEKIWGFDTETEINVVWTFLSYLRKKIAEVGSNVTIKAARTVGYYLE